MSYKVLYIAPFEKQLKRLIRKYPSLKKEMEVLSISLETKPAQGVSLGHNCYKIRLSVSSKGKGKSGGARIITHLHISSTTVYLLTIYDKNEITDITDKELKIFLRFVD